MKTIRGIYYNLNETEYTFDYENFTFYFSSQNYLEKFKTTYPLYLKDETLKLRSKYKCHIYADIMLLLNLYKETEKRGYKVTYTDKDRVLDLSKDYMITFNLKIK